MFGQRDQSQVVIVGRKSQAESGSFQPAPGFCRGQVGSCDLSGAFFLRSRVEPCKVHSESTSDDEVTLAVGSVGEAKPWPEIPIIVFVGFIAIAESAPGEVLWVEQSIQIPGRGAGLVLICPAFFIFRCAAVHRRRGYPDSAIVILTQSQVQDKLLVHAPVVLNIEGIAWHAPPGAGHRPAQGHGVRHTGTGPGGHGQKVCEVPSAQRKSFHTSRVHHCAQRRTGGLNVLDLAFHGNGLSLCTNFQAAVQHRSLRHSDCYGRNLHRLEATSFDPYAIISRWE